MKSIFDIAIVGGGMIGRALALALTSHHSTRNTRVALIDGGQPKPLDLNQYDPRVVALAARAQGFLSRIGVWEDILNTRACPYHKMHVWDGDGTGHISFSSNDIHAAQLGHIIESSVINAALSAHLAKYKASTFSLIENMRVCDFTPQRKIATKEGDMHALTLSDGNIIKARLVVGVDGAQSFIREQSAIQARKWSYGHHAIVTTVKTEKPHSNTAWQRFTQTGPIALLPLLNNDDQDTCSLVWSAQTDRAQALMALDDSAFCAALTRETEAALGQVTQVDKRHSIALNQCHAKRYIDDGIVLAGDAAHVIHPLAGLGANLGFGDVEALFNEIIRAVERNIPVDNSQALRRYERTRQGENLAVMAAMEGFKRLFEADNMLVRYSRNIGLKHCHKNTLFKKILTKIMCQDARNAI